MRLHVVSFRPRVHVLCDNGRDMKDAGLAKLYQSYCALSHEERVSYATKSYAFLREELGKQGYSKMDAAEILLGLTGVLCCCDGIPGKKEHALFKEAAKSHISYDQFVHLLSGFRNKEMVEGIKGFIASLSSEGKDQAYIYCLCLLCADGTIDNYKRRLFKSLIG